MVVGALSVGLLTSTAAAAAPASVVQASPADGVAEKTVTDARVTTPQALAPGDLAQESLPAAISSTTSLSLSSSSIKVGETVTADVTVTGNAPGGTVVLGDNGQDLLTGQLVDGAVRFAIPSLAAGVHSLTATYQGDGGNESSVSVPTAATVSRYDTTVVLTLPTAVTWGTASIIGVRVVGGGPTPTGAIHLQAGGQDLGTHALDGGSSAFAVPATGLPVAALLISATYDGDASNSVAGANGTLVVGARPTVTTVSVAPSAVRAGTRATVTVTVKVAGQPANGVVAVGGPTVSTLNLVGGQAKLLLPAALAGRTYAVTAAYRGTSTDGASTAQAGLTVTKIPTTVKASAPTTGYGDSSRVAVTITGAPLTVGGTASVVFNGKVVASAGVVNGRTTIALPATWGPGTRRVAVSYAGDSTHAGSWIPISIVRVKSNSTFSVTGKNAAFGTSTTVTVAIGRRGSGAFPTGVVTVRQGKNAVAVGQLGNGRVVITMPRGWTPATRSLTVTYAGDAGYNSRSAALRVVTTKAIPTVVIGAITTVTNLGRTRIPINVRGTTGAATGTVTVTYGTVIGKATLSSGSATIVLAPRRVGNYRVTISYSGSANFNGRSVVATFTVIQEPRGAKTFGNGTFRVGFDIRAGLYRVKVAAGSLCYWERDKDNSGSFGSIIANEIESGYGLIRILPTDRFVESTGCGTWHLVGETPGWPFYGRSIPGNGAFLVGKDIAPGLYHQTKAGCYFALLRDVDGGFKDIITNDYSSGASYVTVTSTTYALRTSGCSTWTKVG